MIKVSARRRGEAELCLLRPIAIKESDRPTFIVHFHIIFTIISGGEPNLGIGSTISFGKIVVDGNEGEVPFRTIVMLLALISHVLVSYLTYYLFVVKKISLRWDILDCYSET